MIEEEVEQKRTLVMFESTHSAGFYFIDPMTVTYLHVRERICKGKINGYVLDETFIHVREEGELRVKGSIQAVAEALGMKLTKLPPQINEEELNYDTCSSPSPKETGTLPSSWGALGMSGT